MASKRRQRRKACTNKRSYPTLQAELAPAHRGANRRLPVPVVRTIPSRAHGPEDEGSCVEKERAVAVGAT